VVVTNAFGAVTSAVAVLTVNALPPAQPGHFDSICHLSDGSLRMTMTGTPCTNYIVQWTSDLLAWSNLCTLSAPDGCLQVVDPGATNVPQRFYRLRLAP
jgi:hypothetical protein